jgi:hypothetical protein
LARDLSDACNTLSSASTMRSLAAFMRASWCKARGRTASALHFAGMRQARQLLPRCRDVDVL